MIASFIRYLNLRHETDCEWCWAGRITTSSEPEMVLKTYPDIERYEKTIENELRLCTSKSRINIRRLLFIGMGPLPISAILYARKGLLVEAVDHDAHACEMARRVVRSLGLETKITIRHAEASAADPSSFDLVLLAALVGRTSEDKQHFVSLLLARLRSSALLLARTSHGWRTFIYPPVPEHIPGGAMCGVALPIFPARNSAMLFRPL